MMRAFPIGCGRVTCWLARMPSSQPVKSILLGLIRSRMRSSWPIRRDDSPPLAERCSAIKNPLVFSRTSIHGNAGAAHGAAVRSAPNPARMRLRTVPVPQPHQATARDTRTTLQQPTASSLVSSLPCVYLARKAPTQPPAPHRRGTQRIVPGFWIGGPVSCSRLISSLLLPASTAPIGQSASRQQRSRRRSRRAGRRQ